MKYTNCLVCGSLCRFVPQQPKEVARIDVVTDYEKDRMFLDAVKINDDNKLALEQFLDQVPLGTLYEYIRTRVLWPNGRPLRWSDLQ